MYSYPPNLPSKYEPITVGKERFLPVRLVSSVTGYDVSTVNGWVAQKLRGELKANLDLHRDDKKRRWLIGERSLAVFLRTRQKPIPVPPLALALLDHLRQREAAGSSVAMRA